MYYNEFLREINLFSMKKITYYWKNRVGTEWVPIVTLRQPPNLIMVHVVDTCRKFCIPHYPLKLCDENRIYIGLNVFHSIYQKAPSDFYLSR